MAQRPANGDVALNGHGRQVHGRVPGGEDRQQDEDAANGHVNPVEDIAENEEHGCGGQLHRVV